MANNIESINLKPNSPTKTKLSNRNEWKHPFSTMNFLFIGLGLLTIIAGYYLMSSGISSDPADHTTWMNPTAVDISPIVLVIGYCVIIPFAIMYKQNVEE